MKPNQHFKIKKQTKRLMTTIVDPHKRGAFKRAMIEAQLEAEQGQKNTKGG